MDAVYERVFYSQGIPCISFYYALKIRGDQQERYALIDVEDIPFIKRHTWSLSVESRVFMHDRAANKKKYLFRLIAARMMINLHKPIGHINGNYLDFRRCNIGVLRHATRIGSSGVRGIVRHKNRWVIRLSIHGKRTYFGSYTTVGEACTALMNIV